ncbi:MAG: multicopper oxidase domain-containing protein [Myxococcota bacterium]|nr:multicopper oxidase domain-containing protein [Myxococcota bacterium]
MKTETDTALRHVSALRRIAASILMLAGLIVGGTAQAVISGTTGVNFDLTAKEGYVSMGDGATVYIWGYALDGGNVQLPGPTLIVTEGETITVTLHNDLAEAVSITFPGQTDVTTTGADSEGYLAGEAAATGGEVTYTFTATRPGTYQYHSGSNVGLQIEMGLSGALIIKPNAMNQAYNHPSTAFHQEYLFFLQELDPHIHTAVEAGLTPNLAERRAQYWLINGRSGPDTFFDDNIPWLPTQPYGAMARTHPNETVLMRVVGAGLDVHSFHTHGANFRVLARDGRMRETIPGVSGADAGLSDFTLTVAPGQTYDATWSWRGEDLGWDIFGHAPGDPCEPSGEECDPASPIYDHGKAIPVWLPEQQFLTFGGFWSGSPFLGQEGALPVGEGGLNLDGGYFYMWHSHIEAELVNFDIAPGGMMTMMIVEAPGVPIP